MQRDLHVRLRLELCEGHDTITGLDYGVVLYAESFVLPLGSPHHESHVVLVGADQRARNGSAHRVIDRFHIDGGFVPALLA